jgi:hypothetical protein
MGLLIGILFLLYLGSLFIAIPILINLLGSIMFPPGNHHLILGKFLPLGDIGAGVVPAPQALIFVFFWTVGGLYFFRAYAKRIDAKLRQQIRTLAPDGYSPEIVLHGRRGMYLGISPSTNGMVIIDPFHKVKRYETIDKLQGCRYEESASIRGCYGVTILFDSYEVPSMTFRIGNERNMNDFLAKLDYAMRGGGRKHGPEVAAESIRAFESLRAKHGLPPTAPDGSLA